MTHDDVQYDESKIDPALCSMLEHMIKIESSELILSVGSPAVFRVKGEHLPARVELSVAQLQSMLDSILTVAQQEEFETALEADVRVSYAGGHFRINTFVQQGRPGMVVRSLRTQVPSLTELELPDALSALMNRPSGLILCVGDPDAGRAVTLAAIIEHRNASAPGHIITVEDPIEFVHARKQCIVTQREVGFDTRSCSDALHHAQRQAPDLVVIGEIRDAESMDAAIALADSGRLCVAGLAADTTTQAIQRALAFFPSARQDEVRARLARNLRGVVSRRMIAGVQPERVAVCELMLDTTAVIQAIKSGELQRLPDAMAKSEHMGCRTLETSLLERVSSGRVAPPQALEVAEHQDALRVRIEEWIRSVHGAAYGGASVTQLRLARDPYAAAPRTAQPARPVQTGEPRRQSGTMRTQGTPDAESPRPARAG